ncbi:MAG: hypothetical protein KH586_05935 [Tannerella sp.]|uniref:hypothetical protein n=1 Tax=uncultured Coprobacter sp. TaxID=1720550 RepID=UPI00260F78C9|nr:hypothetical protein [uncultured Coprobacter sp.]MBS6268471.1 hypothetical protein [Tannerella sp.]
MKTKFIIKKTGANNVMYLTGDKERGYCFKYYNMETYTPTTFGSKKEAINALEIVKESLSGGFAEILEIYDL